MRSRSSDPRRPGTQTAGPKWSILPTFLAVALFAAPAVVAQETTGASIEASTQESIVFFKNGRALRVAAYRVDGDWAYLVVTQRANPEEAPSEIMVRRDSIERLKDDVATQAASGNMPLDRRRGRTANGPGAVLTPSGLPRGQVSNSGGGGSMAHVPAANTAEARKYRPRSSSPDIDISKSGAGSVYFEPLRNLRVPQHFKDAAREYHALKAKQRELDHQAALEGKTAARILPPVRWPRGYTPPPELVDPNAPPPVGTADPENAAEPDGSGS